MARHPSHRREPDGRVRAVIEALLPCVDGGRSPAKRIEGDRVEVEAACVADGHDVLRVWLRRRAEAEDPWVESEMKPRMNDLWRGSFDAGLRLAQDTVADHPEAA